MAQALSLQRTRTVLQRPAHAPLSPAYPWASADNPPRPSPRHALVAVLPTALAAGL
jgi:hypothetical protein